MIKFNPWAVLLIVACIVIVILLGVVFYKGSSTQNPTPVTMTGNVTSTAQDTATSTNTTIPATGTKQPSTSKPVPVKAPSQPAAPSISFINPVANDTLKIATQNPIIWTRAGNITGELDLYSATTDAEVGVILPQVGPNQTSYTWNTRDIFLSRTNPLKTTVTPGTYEIRLAYDGNGLKPAFSPSFTITN